MTLPTFCWATRSKHRWLIPRCMTSIWANSYDFFVQDDWRAQRQSDAELRAAL